MKSLRELYDEHRGNVSDKWSSYLNVYDELLAPYRRQNVAILEIGIQNGGSLEIWSQYFDKASRIVGCDVDENCSKLSFGDARIRVCIGDASDLTVQREVAKYGPFDVVVDDGSHRASDVVRTFISLFQSLRDGGIYIVEDLHCSYWEEFEGGLYSPVSAMSFFKALGDALNREHWGVSKSIGAFFRAFSDRYDATVDDDLCGSIHSIAFYNSMCVIKKLGPENNRLGPRCIAGTVEAVSSGHRSLHGTTLSPMDQELRLWSRGVTVPESEMEALRQVVSERDATIASMAGVLERSDTRRAGLEAKLEERERDNAKLHSELGAAVQHTSKLEADLQQQEFRAGQLKSELAEYEALVAVHRETAERLFQESTEKGARVDHLEHEVATLSAEIHSHETEKVELSAQLEALRARVQGLEASTSWRLTNPLRALGDWARSHKRMSILVRAVVGGQRGHAARMAVARAMWRRLPLEPRYKARLRGWIQGHWSAVDSAGIAVATQAVRGDYICTSASDAPTQHGCTVDIVICVHNALADFRRCIESVVACTPEPYHLVLVDDGSDADTRLFIESIADVYAAQLIRNEFAVGYTRAANMGMHATQADFVLLLNSDTVVTEGWLDRLVACAYSDQHIGIVGPLSNTASWQSVPALFEDGDWAENRLDDGTTIAEMAALVARTSGLVRPRVGFVNGFCLLIRREVIDTVGYFDEEYFGAGYGEENDYCIRCRRAGWELVLADDVYVFHAQSRSYGTRRRDLARHADSQLQLKYHLEREILPGLKSLQEGLPLVGIRARVQAEFTRRKGRSAAKGIWEGARVAVVLPIAEEGGGGHVILQECEAMEAMGVSVTILNLEAFREQFETSYPQRNVEVEYFTDPSKLVQCAYKTEMPFDLVVATTNTSVPWLYPAPRNGPRLAYYVQDFEPDFYAVGSSEYRAAIETYTMLPGAQILTKTRWNAEKLRNARGVAAQIVGPSVDPALFRPRERRDDSVRVCAMVRPSTPRRAPERTLDLLDRIQREWQGAIEVHVFGCTSNEFYDLSRQLQIDVNGRIVNHGRLSHAGVAELLSQGDIFVDCSHFQAMGLTALEAMASGLAVVVPKQGGTRDFVADGVNGILVDTADELACQAAIRNLIQDPSYRRRLAMRAAQDVVAFSPEHSAERILGYALGETWRPQVC